MHARARLHMGRISVSGRLGPPRQWPDTYRRGREGRCQQPRTNVVLGTASWPRRYEPWSWARRAAGSDVAARTNDRRTRGTVDNIAPFGAGERRGAMDHTGGTGGTTRVAGRRRTGERAGAVCFADALPVRARARAAAVRFARHMARGRLAGEVARASAATGARPVRAHRLAAAVVAVAGRVAGRRGADEPTVVARWAGAGSVATAPDDRAAGGRQHERQGGEETRSCAHAHRERNHPFAHQNPGRGS